MSHHCYDAEHSYPSLETGRGPPVKVCPAVGAELEGNPLDFTSRKDNKTIGIT